MLTAVIWYMVDLYKQMYQKSTILCGMPLIYGSRQ